MKTKITVQQIADAVDMSKYAVSRALSGKSGVSQESRELIITTAQKMGYQFKNSSTSEPFSIGNGSTIQVSNILVVFPDKMYQNKESIYWGPVFNGISNQLNKQKINIVTLTEPFHDSIFTLLNTNAIQGVIVISSVSKTTLTYLQDLSIPIVIVDHIDNAIKADTIFVDNFAIIASILKKLINKGYTNFQFIGQIKEAQSFYERWLAFKNTLEEAGIQLNQMDELLYFSPHLKPVVRELFRHEPLPQVFICANDLYAYYTHEALTELGYTINKDYILTGFDFTHELPLYATVNVPKEDLGKRSVDQMIWRIHNLNAPHEKKLIHANIIYNQKD